MWFRRTRKNIAVKVTWSDRRGVTKPIMRQVVSESDNTAVILFPDGKELRVEVYAVKKGTYYGQFLPRKKGEGLRYG